MREAPAEDGMRGLLLVVRSNSDPARPLASSLRRSRSPEGQMLAEVFAHAAGASVGRTQWCAFDDATAEARARYAYGAVAAVRALHADAA
jgi:hypothetical protein